MDPQLRSYLEDRYRSAEWLYRSTLDEGLFTRGYFISDADLSDWQLDRTRRIPSPPVPLATRFASVVPAAPTEVLETVWTPDDSSPETRVLTDVFTFPSFSAAQDATLLLLGRFESPVIEWRPDLGLGDAAFGAPEPGSTIVFARANLVYLTRNAGRDLVDLVPAARRLDENLVSRPPAPADGPARAEFASRHTATPSGREPGAWTLELETTSGQRSAPAQPVWYKIFSRGSEVADDQGRVVCRARTSDVELTVFAVDADGNHRPTSPRLV